MENIRHDKINEMSDYVFILCFLCFFIFEFTGLSQNQSYAMLKAVVVTFPQDDRGITRVLSRPI